MLLPPAPPPAAAAALGPQHGPERRVAVKHLARRGQARRRPPPLDDGPAQQPLVDTQLVAQVGERLRRDGKVELPDVGLLCVLGSSDGGCAFQGLGAEGG